MKQGRKRREKRQYWQFAATKSWKGASLQEHHPKRGARVTFTGTTCAQRCTPQPYLRAESFGELLHAAQRGAQVDIVAVQEDAQQRMGGTGIGDQLEGDTRTILTSRNKATLQQLLRVNNNQLKITDARTACETSGLTPALKGSEVSLPQRATPCPPKHLLTAQPSLDSLQPGAQGTAPRKEQCSISVPHCSRGVTGDTPPHPFPSPPAYLVSKEHVINNVIVNHRCLIHQGRDLAA